MHSWYYRFAEGSLFTFGEHKERLHVLLHIYPYIGVRYTYMHT